VRYPAALPWICVVAAVSTGCDRDDGDSSSGSTGGSSGSSGSSGSTGGFWAVGQTGAMVRISPAGAVAPYPVDLGVDLWAIACVGAREAWAVGEGGTVLRTQDAGARWEPQDAGITGDLYAVAVSEGAGVVFAGGDDGVIWAPFAGSFTRIQNWTYGTVVALAAPADEPWAYAATLAGEVVRVHADGPVDPRFGAGIELSGVATDATGDVVVVVGAAGMVLLSHDAGASFEMVETGIATDLWAVTTLAGDGAFLAVGDRGRLVRYDGFIVDVLSVFDPTEDLRAIHMRADGMGQIVGHEGIVHVTGDGGRTWRTVLAGNDVHLEGVDDFHAAPHG